MRNETSVTITDPNSSADDDEYREQLPDIFGSIKRKCRSCSWQIILDRLPVVRWMPQYKWSFLAQDFVAGLTVGLTAIPQGIAYAVVAGLSPQYGLYAAFMGCFVYIIFGSCKDITVGPTAIMSLMVQRYVKDSPDYAILSCFISGIIITLFGIFNLGFLVQFISTPVTAGFTTAAAITIGSGQISPILGLSSKSNEFLASWINVFENIFYTRLWDAVLGISTLIALLLLRKLKDIKGGFKIYGKYISLSRNAIAVIFGTTLAYILSTNGITPFRLTGTVESGLPPFQLPPFSTVSSNGTTIEFPEMISTLGSSIIAIPLIAMLESIAIAKAFSKGKTVDATQEMIALGICNVAGSFVSSMPVTGSFTRSAVNNSSGVRTTFGGFFTGVLVLLSLGFLAETFYFIPKATLSAIIISAMVFMVEYETAIEIWKSKKSDIIPFSVTILACLFLGLEFGILCGVAVNIMFVLYKTARPEVDVSQIKVDGKEILLIVPDQSLIFSSAEYFKYKVLKHVIKSDQQIKTVVVNGEFVKFIDTTVALNLLAIYEDLKVLHCDIIFWNWKRQSLGVVWRLKREMGSHFKNGESLEDILLERYQSDVTLISRDM